MSNQITPPTGDEVSFLNNEIGELLALLREISKAIKLPIDQPFRNLPAHAKKVVEDLEKLGGKV